MCKNCGVELKRNNKKKEKNWQAAPCFIELKIVYLHINITRVISI